MKLKKEITKLLIAVSVFGADTVNATTGTGWVMPDNPGGLPEDFMVSLRDITDWFIGLAIMVAVLAIIYGGVVYAAAGGDQERITSAKKSIKYAIMGLAMAGIAYAIVNVVIEILGGTGAAPAA